MLFFGEVYNLIAERKKVVIRMKGGSMNPYLRDGTDAVVLSPYSLEDLQAGVIVLFSYHGKYLLHRIIGCKGGYFVIQGDGVCKNTEIVPAQDIIAVVQTVVRPNGKEVSVQSPCARLYWQCWRRLQPFRRYLLWLWRKFNI